MLYRYKILRITSTSSDEEDYTISDKYNVNIQLMSIIIIINGFSFHLFFTNYFTLKYN